VREVRTSINFLRTFLFVVAEEEEFESIVSISAGYDSHGCDGGDLKVQGGRFLGLR
jgi:hypothetical protein